MDGGIDGKRETWRKTCDAAPTNQSLVPPPFPCTRRRPASPHTWPIKIRGSIRPASRTAPHKQKQCTWLWGGWAFLFYMVFLKNGDVFCSMVCIKSSQIPPSRRRVAQAYEQHVSSYLLSSRLYCYQSIN